MQLEPLPVNDYPDQIVKLGDKFTIEGIKVIAPNRLIYNCKSGEETEFIASDQPICFSFRKADKEDAA